MATLALKIAWMVKKHREGILSVSKTGGDLDAEESEESQTEQTEEKEAQKG